jgi:hypothetical protein
MVFLPRVRALIFLFFFGGDIFSRGAIWCSSGVLCYFFPFLMVVSSSWCRWKFADRTKKKRASTVFVLHKLLAKLDALKKQIDNSKEEDLPRIQSELEQAIVTVRTQNFEPRWRDNIMMLIERYKGTLAEKIGASEHKQ